MARTRASKGRPAALVVITPAESDRKTESDVPQIAVAVLPWHIARVDGAEKGARQLDGFDKERGAELRGFLMNVAHLLEPLEILDVEIEELLAGVAVVALCEEPK